MTAHRTFAAVTFVLLVGCSGAATPAIEDDAVHGADASTASAAPSASGTVAPTGPGDASVPASTDAGGNAGHGDGGTSPPSPAFLPGTNLSGLEFNPGTVPGTANTDYGVPGHSDVDYFVGKKMPFLRLPFLWERMQRTLGGNLDPTYLAIVTDLVTYATGKGATVLLDVHNYARYDGAVIGSGDANAPTAAQFGDLWSRLATLFKGNPGVVFGLMNEPNGMATELWLTDANAAIAAIRQTGATNLITVPGNGYTGAHSWTTGGYGTPNGTVMLGVVDPANHFIYEVHQYLDADSSGTHDTCNAAPAGSQSLAAFTAWAKTNHVRAMIGEFGAANNTTCLSDLADFLGSVDQNKDVWAGWTYWSAGPWWGSYMFSIEPSASGADAPQMATLLDHL
jgi:endoglucanase